MFSKSALSKVGTVVIVAGVAFGWSARANAQASERADAWSRAGAAQQKADAARQHAVDLANAGGWAYKTGLVARAQRDAALYQAEANQALAEANACPPPATPTPAEAAAMARVDELRQAGGWAYKTGAVARAEQDVASTREPAAQPTLSPEQAAAMAKLETLRQAGGWAYKSGAVARAERDVLAQTPPTAPTSACGGTEQRPRPVMTSRR